ncbi:MAG: lipoate--protein ligase family protein [Undibacterium sp.]|nr:lipoate--protein ligase family protein [Opitutaceae bacterium]
MNFDILPTRSGGVAENMATDFLLLQRYPAAGVARFRHYGWRGPAWTFGYSQKIAFVRTQLPAGANPNEICRRPTGGGVVDHRDDWTYALVIPRGYALEELRASESYRRVHECLATALRAQGVPAVVKASCEPPVERVDRNALPDEPAPLDQDAPPTCGPAGVCFRRAELYDVVHGDTGEKIAGAAQKRNKHGLLFQGSLCRPAVGAAPAVDWEAFGGAFIAALAAELATEPKATPWPEFNEDEVSGLVDQYASAEWVEYR